MKNRFKLSLLSSAFALCACVGQNEPHTVEFNQEAHPTNAIHLGVVFTQENDAPGENDNIRRHAASNCETTYRARKSSKNMNCYVNFRTVDSNNNPVRSLDGVIKAQCSLNTSNQAHCDVKEIQFSTPRRHP